jgi:homoserine dehydrogenase/homoserine acetyltransferase
MSVITPERFVVRRPVMTLEGREARDVELVGYVVGRPLGSAPVIAIVGGITASPFPFGAPDAEAWWPALEPLVDPARHTIVTLAWPGNGSSAIAAPLSACGLADLLAAWLDGIGCTEPVTYLGASLGGLVGIALAARHPARVARLVTISAGMRPDGWGTATRHLQRELVRDGQRAGDVATGMARARQLGMLTYRGRDELDTRFGALGPELERPPVAAYLDHHGKRFAERFPMATFLLLSEAIDRTRLDRAALARVTADVLVVGVPGDMLFPFALQHELFRELQAAGASAQLWKLDSELGHDAFLGDQDKLAAILADTGFLAANAAPARAAFVGLGARPVRELRIGMIGCGTVGGGVLELLHRQESALAARYGVRFRVAKLAVRDLAKPRGAHADNIPRTTNAAELVADPDVDVIVEVAGGDAVEPVLAAALAAGKPVVTANKALLAKRLAALGVLAQRTETPLLCEAAAAAAIPIIRQLSHRADEIERLRAIVNGTCNFVLTRLEQGVPLDRAIARAQELGFAEADPAQDIDGHDAAAKLSILAYRAFGAWIPPSAMPVRGIRALSPIDCELAASLGLRIRLVAHAEKTSGGVAAAVEPVALPDWHLLASVEEEYNAVYLETAASGDLSLFGKGAGALPTASAVLGDLIELAQDNTVQWPEPRETAALPSPPRRHFVRADAAKLAHLPIERHVAGACIVAATPDDAIATLGAPWLGVIE